MAGKKYGVIIFGKTPPEYSAMAPSEQAKAGKAIEATLKKYAGQVEIVRRYWTSAFTHEASDVFVMECDDPAVLHAFNEDLNRAMARAAGGDAMKYGSTVHVTFGLNPDAEQPRGRRR
jgi:hypothetical protein